MPGYLPFGRSISELLSFRQSLKDFIIATKSQKKGTFLKYEELCSSFAETNADYPQWEFPGGIKLGASNVYRLALYFLNGYCFITDEMGRKHGSRIVPEFNESPEEVNEWCNVSDIVLSPEAGNDMKKSLRKELDQLFKKPRK
jgi:hypothetical protein